MFPGCSCCSAEETGGNVTVTEQAASESPPAEEPVDKTVFEEPAPAEPTKQEPPPVVEPPVVEEQPPAADQENKAPVQNSVAIEFDDGGQARTFNVVKKPLGVVFNGTTVPITVDSVRASSHGEELGIQKGWALKTVGNEDVSKKEHAAVIAILQTYVAPLPNDSKSVNLCFGTSGKDQIMTVSRKPLGMQIGGNSRMQITVSSVKPRGHSEQVGIKVDWVLKKVGDEDVSNLSYDEAKDVLERRVSELPTNEN
jgi:hypothetical protein